MTDLSDMPVVAITRDGHQKTTMAKALDDLAEQEMIKRKARTCDACHKFQRHEQLTTVPTDDGDTQRLCSDCLDDDPAAKALLKAQWRQAFETIDAAMMGTERWFNLAKSQGAADRLAKADPIGNFGKMAADYRRRWAAEDRVVRVVKAERTKKETTRLKKQAKRLKKKTKAAQLRKARAVLSMVDLTARATALQAAVTAQIDGIAKRVAIVVANAERGYGAAAKQAEIQRVALVGKQDQEQAMWRDRANATNDPDLRAYYLAKAAGGDLDED